MHIQPSAFLPNPTLDEIKQLSVFHPTVAYNGGTLFLSERGVAAIRRLGDVCGSLAIFSDAVSRREVGIEIGAQLRRLA